MYDLGKGHSIQKDQVEEPSVAKIVNDCREAQKKKISENIVDKFPEGSICRGIMAQQDLVHPQIQRGLEHDMEYFAPREGLDAKQFEGFNHMRSLFSKSCLNREVKWRHPSKRRAFHALQCADCFKCVQPSQEGSQDLLKNFRRKLTKKAVLVDSYLSVSLGKIPFSSDEGKEAVCSLTKTNGFRLSAKGKALQLLFKNLNDFTKSSNTMKRAEDYDKWFDVTFRKFYKDHGNRFRKSIIYDVLVNGMNRMQGKSETAVGPKIMNLYCAIASKDPATARLISANFHGPAWRNIRKAMKNVDEVTGSHILSRTSEEAANLLCDYYRTTFDKNDVVGFSVSIDASKVASVVQPNTRYGHIIGGAVDDSDGGYANNHYIPIPENDDLSDAIMLEFAEKKRKMASEVKLATVCFQWTKDGKLPFFQLMARPQTKNENSKFNYTVLKCLELAELLLRKEGYKTSFVCSANDGVSCDSRFVLQTLTEFLQGNRSSSAHTDTNHNVKNWRYQLIGIGLGFKTIGVFLIDPGLLKCTDISNTLWRVKDFASDLLVLRLASSTTVEKVLKLKCQEPQSQIILSLSLFFMRVHLCAVNCKGTLTAKERVTMLWSSLLVCLHVDGVSITTKRNWVTECISMVFMMMRFDVMSPHRLTSEPSEHSFAIMRGICREFTMNDFISLVQKQVRFWKSITNGQLVTMRSTETSGYTATMTSQATKKGVKVHAGHVEIETSLQMIEAQVGISDNFNVANHIWVELREVLNKSSNLTRTFLQNVCKVQEMHPLMSEFGQEDTPVTVLDRLTRCMKEGDKMFKKEGVDAAVDAEEGNTNLDEESVPSAPEFHDDGGMCDTLLKDILDAAEKNKKSSTDPASCVPIPDEDIIDEEVHEADSRVFTSFAKVLTSDWNVFLSTPGIILDSMDLMDMGKRDKGAISNVQKYKSLNGRWFGAKKQNEEKEVQTIERGSIVSLEENGEKWFVVRAVFRESGNKWYMSTVVDNPSWPIDPVKGKNYRLIMSMVKINPDEDSGGNRIELKNYGDLEDGVNVHASFKCVKDLTTVKRNLLKINI